AASQTPARNITERSGRANFKRQKPTITGGKVGSPGRKSHRDYRTTEQVKATAKRNFCLPLRWYSILLSWYTPNMNTTTTEPLLTADEFMRLYDSETRVELFRGRVVRYPVPQGPHGFICGNAGFLIAQYVREHKLGRVFTNDTFVRVRLKEPTDTVR